MRKDLVDITLVVDRSGSMMGIKDDAQGGINQFIQEQKNAEGDALFTLIEFDHEYNSVCSGADINIVGEYTLKPRGATALLDAVGRAITETEERISSMKKEDRPGLVIMAIVTDGHENDSREFSKIQIKDMIRRKQNKRKRKWQFIFLGADQTAFDEAVSWGIYTPAISVYNTQNVGTTYTTLGNSVANYRASWTAGDDVGSFAFSDADRAAMTSTTDND